MSATQKCPYCAEEIAAEATRCRYCRSRLTAFNPEHWHRDHPEQRLAGVAVAVARAMAVPVGAVRIGFIALTFFHFLGPLLYGALWLIIPWKPGEESLLERHLARAKECVARLRGQRPHSAPPHNATSAAGPGDAGPVSMPGGNGQ